MLDPTIKIFGFYLLLPLIKILTFTFIFSTMLAIGLMVTGNDILEAIRDRRLITRVLAANLILIPLLGLLLVLIVPLPPGTRLALALLALAPGGLTAIQFTYKVKGSLAFAAALAFVLTLVSIVLTPILAKIILPVETGVDVPYLRVILFVILCLLVPLFAGFGIRSISESAARILGKVMLIFSNTTFVTMIVVTMAVKREAMNAVGLTGVWTLLIFIVVSMIIGWWMGGPDRGNRRVHAIATSMRNAGLCLLIAMRSFPESGADVAVIAFMGLMVPPNMLFTVYHAVMEKRRSKRDPAR